MQKEQILCGVCCLHLCTDDALGRRGSLNANSIDIHLQGFNGTCFFLMSLRAAISSGASDGTLVTTPVPGVSTDIYAVICCCAPALEQQTYC